MGLGLKPPKGGTWPTTMETIARCVAAHHHTVSAAEHADGVDLAADIVRYAYTLREMVRGSDEVRADFVRLLHAWIENRALNVALHETPAKSLQDELIFLANVE